MIEIPRGAVIYGKVTLTNVRGTPQVNVHGIGGPMTMLTAKKGSKEVLLPSATILNPSLHGKYVAWDGEQYVLRPTLESIQETDTLTLIGLVDDPKDWLPFRRDIAAFTAMKELLEGQAPSIPESFLRRALAKQYHCTPDEITQKQIMENVAYLGDLHPRIHVTVSEPVSRSGPSEPNPSVADVKSMSNSKRKPKKLAPLERKRRHVIFGALQINLVGRKYCAHLDQKQLPIPDGWRAEGCPDSYVEAYRDGSGRWAKRIQDEKSRYNRKYRQASPLAREELIQGTSHARRTRR